MGCSVCISTHGYIWVSGCVFTQPAKYKKYIFLNGWQSSKCQNHKDTFIKIIRIVLSLILNSGL